MPDPVHGVSSGLGSLRVTLAESGDREAWDRYVASCSAAASYHRWGWGDLISEQFGLRQFNLLARRGEAVCGVLPLFAQRHPLGGTYFTSLPFLNYAGILADDAGAVQALVEAARNRVAAERALYAEFRHPPGTACDLPISTAKVRAVLALPPGPDELWRSFPAKLRSQVRRPQKEGMVTLTGTDQLLGDFYEVLSRKWRELGSPIYRSSFFEAVLHRFPGESVIVAVQHGGEVVGAGWLHFYGPRCEIVWAGTRREFDRLSPNMLLYWSAMQHAIARGSTLFDFGRSTRDAGTHRFKTQWGAQTEDLPWHYVAGRAAVPPAGLTEGVAARLFRSVWRRLPLPITVALGHHVAKRLPL